MAALLGAGQRLDRAEPVDEQAVAGVGGHPAGAGVRRGDQPLLLERGHVVADGGRRDAEVVALDQRLGADRLAGLRRSPGRWRAARRAGGPRSCGTSSPGRRTSAGTHVLASAKSTWLSRRARLHGRRARAAEPIARHSLPSVTDRYGSDVLVRRLATARRAGAPSRSTAETGPGRRGRRDRLVRRRRAGREGRRDARRAPRGPARAHQGLPARPGLPARRRAGRAHPTTARRPRRSWPRRARPPPARRAARGPSRAPGPGWRAGRGSSSRASTTPSWSRRSGAPTCGSRAWSSRCSTASTTSSAAIARLRSPGPGAGWACSSTTSCRAPRSTASSQEAAQLSPYAAHVLVLGHPYVDVWQSVRPERLGLSALAGHPARPVVEGRHLRRTWAGRTTTQADIARAWKRILGTVRSYADLEPTLLAGSRS